MFLGKMMENLIFWHLLLGNLPPSPQTLPFFGPANGGEEMEVKVVISPFAPSPKQPKHLDEG